jgi:hypothetical protein
MTWKSYTAVSGATLLAGWLASAPPSNAPTTSARVEPPAASDLPRAAAQIEDEAARLQAGIREQAEYRQPERNPFRFGSGRPARAAAAAVVEAPPAEAFVPPPPPPPVTLAGIAEDQTAESMQRTAILSSPSGVLLVKEGDEVLGQYRVSKIESGAIELTRPDGSTVRLSLP